MSDQTLNTKPLKASEDADKGKYLGRTIEHLDVTKYPGIVPVVEAMAHMAYSSRDLYRAADIYDRMLRDRECGQHSEVHAVQRQPREGAAQDRRSRFLNPLLVDSSSVPLRSVDLHSRAECSIRRRTGRGVSRLRQRSSPRCFCWRARSAVARGGCCSYWAPGPLTSVLTATA